MQWSRTASVPLLAVTLAIASVAAANAPSIGAGARFEAHELGPGWHRGFFNQTRAVPPCYVLLTFEPHAASGESRRVKQILPITRVQRLQVTAAPGTSLQEWDGLVLPPGARRLMGRSRADATSAT